MPDRNSDSTRTAAQTRDGDSEDAADGSERPGGGRTGDGEIEVPIRLYKTVTVFSTLIAVVCVILGFVLLDAATLQVSVLRSLLADVLGTLGVLPSGDVLAGVLAALGLLSIGFGAGVYVFGTRFRPPGMGNSQEDSDERSDNG